MGLITFAVQPASGKPGTASRAAAQHSFILDSCPLVVTRFALLIAVQVFMLRVQYRAKFERGSPVSNEETAVAVESGASDDSSDLASTESALAPQAQ